MSYQSKFTGAEIDAAVQEARSLVGKNIVFCATAEVGQTIVVEEVDETGRPTKWKAVPMASGSGSSDGVGSGEPGVGIADIQLKSESETGKTYTIYLTNGNTYDFTAPAGSDGDDGVSVVSVEQTTTSTADGGTNIITVKLSNDKKFTFEIKNGSKGSKGDSPVKGTDYFTEEEKTEIAQAAAELVEVPEGFSGDYNDLRNKPTLFSGSYNDLTDRPSAFAPAAHNQAASTITGGTFAGQVVANSSGQAAGSYVLRNSKLSSAEETPTVNGQICWKYK